VFAAVSIQCVRVGQSTFAHAAQVAENGRLLNQAFAARQAATRKSLHVLAQVLDAARKGFLILGDDGCMLRRRPALACWPATVRRLAHRLQEWAARLKASIRQVARDGRPDCLVMPDGWGRSWRLACAAWALT
jgi:hypothetical protein